VRVWQVLKVMIAVLVGVLKLLHLVNDGIEGLSDKTRWLKTEPADELWTLWPMRTSLGVVSHAPDPTMRHPRKREPGCVLKPRNSSLVNGLGMLMVELKRAGISAVPQLRENGTVDVLQAVEVKLELFSQGFHLMENVLVDERLLLQLVEAAQIGGLWVEVRHLFVCLEDSQAPGSGKVAEMDSKLEPHSQHVSPLYSD
jgi:hypothetical protein